MMALAVVRMMKVLNDILSFHAGACPVSHAARCSGMVSSCHVCARYCLYRDADRLLVYGRTGFFGVEFVSCIFDKEEITKSIL
jgi:hypothetical protein